jgi:hypothetical protein
MEARCFAVSCRLSLTRGVPHLTRRTRRGHSDVAVLFRKPRSAGQRSACTLLLRVISRCRRGGTSSLFCDVTQPLLVVSCRVTRHYIGPMRDCRLSPRVAENWVLLSHYAASCGNSVPTFRDNLSVPTSRPKNPQRRVKNVDS